MGHVSRSGRSLAGRLRQLEKSIQTGKQTVTTWAEYARRCARGDAPKFEELSPAFQDLHWKLQAEKSEPRPGR